MNRRLFIALTLLLIVLGIDAQVIDQRLTRLVEHTAKTRAAVQRQKAPGNIVVHYNADGSIKAFPAIATLKSGAECPTAQLEQMGIKVNFVVGDMVGLIIPADKLMELKKVDALLNVRADEYARIYNDEARKTTGVDHVNTAEAAVGYGLPNAFTGEGVVLGIIDSGIDFNHAAFCNPDGSTRIKKALIYKDEKVKEYSENEISTLTADEEDSHGTHTAATAGGSDTGNGQKGVAPKADLILCGLGSDLTDSNIAICMKRIFEYADSVGKPAVINMSMGSTLDMHDGSEITSRLVATLTENGTKPGRAVVIASGNSGEHYQSIVKKMAGASDVLKTVLGAYYVTNENKARYKAGYFLYADDHKDFSVEVKVVNIATGAVESVGNHLIDLYDNIPYNLSIEKATDVPTAKGGVAVTYKLKFNFSAELDAPNLRLAFFIKPSSAGQTIKMVCDGDSNDEPCFDAPTKGGYDFKAAGYTKGSGDLTCSAEVCNDAVISVGSFITRTHWTDCEGKPHDYAESTLTGKEQVIGEISDFSSYGIDDNGKVRPSVIAPGQGIISAANNYDRGFFQYKNPGVPDEDTKMTYLIGSVDLNGRKSWYLLEQGTSMACPHVAGIVTLWMQAKPTLTVNEILEIMKETSFNDKYTTDTEMIPSGNTAQAGYGKIDCLEGLKKILNVTSIEELKAYDWKQSAPAQLNYVDAPVYDVKGQQVPNTHKGMVIYKGRKYVNK